MNTRPLPITGLRATLEYDAIPPRGDADYIAVQVDGRVAVRDVDRVIAVTVGYDANGQLASVVFADNGQHD